ncbi:MAG: VCBS repeat-containing protein, partial [Planctomycetaceae bacterium]|nr:VCBS repeat-containing protein [Planctomycetaceae bacterium]
GLMTQDSPPPKKRRFWIFGLVLVLLLAAVGGGLWTWYRFRVWPQETRQVLQRKNLAVAYLENEQFEKCDPLLVELGEEWPSELLPARNLAISRVLKVKATGPTIAPEKFAKALADAQVALERLRTLEGDTAVVQLLTGRLAGYADNDEARIKAYTEAAKLDPQSPAAWGELFVAARASSDPVRQIQAREALKRAYALQPGNLFLLLEMLSLQAQQKDKQLANTLTEARKVVAPFAGAISRRSRGRVEILKFIDEALSALHPGEDQPPEWNRVSLQVAYLVNVLRPENAHQRDLSRIQRYELEYLISDFSPEFYEVVYLPDTFDAPPITVTFQPLDAVPAFEQLSDIRQAQFIDFELDGQLEVLVVRDAAVEVFGRNDKQEWESLAVADVPAGMKGAITADLDRDFQEAPTDFHQPGETEEKSPGICLDADPDFVVYGDNGMVILKNVLDHN